MAHPVSTRNVVLPPIRTLFPHSAFSSPSSSPSSDEEMPFMPLRQKKPHSHEQLYPVPRMPLPLSAPKQAQHNRRISTSSTSSPPSLTHSPSPTPSPPPSRATPPRVRLVPCSMRAADVVVVAPGSTTHTSSHRLPSPSSSAVPASSRPTLLVGSAIARAAKEKDERKMHPYRIIRERRA